ncbi:MAG: hypothetical protein KKD73_13040 [Proteobacteria bacterium]|nr:hypothetical protein [Pseudomonadota bacterium]MBU1641683.1 hypothetical protein [Pseudomonadota bacterium]
MTLGRYGKIWLPATRLCFFRDAGQNLSTVATVDDVQQPHEGKGILYCRQCHAPVTREQERLNVLGKHCHVFPNPEGIVFEVGCFGLAPGCLRQGRATDRYSWFPPHAWCFAQCRKCQIHLGWYYEAEGKTSFYGLILNRLVAETD